MAGGALQLYESLPAGVHCRSVFRVRSGHSDGVDRLGICAQVNSDTFSRQRCCCARGYSAIREQAMQSCWKCATVITVSPSTPPPGPNRKRRLTEEVDEPIPLVESTRVSPAPDLYRDIPEYRLTRRQRRLRFPDATRGRHRRSSHRHVRDLVHGRCDGTRHRVVAASSWRALAPNSSIPRTGGMAASIVVFRQ